MIASQATKNQTTVLRIQILLILTILIGLLLPATAIGYQCKYQSGTRIAYASCNNCQLPGANCPQGTQCPRYYRGYTLVSCQSGGGGKSYSGSCNPIFSLQELIDVVKNVGSKSDNFSVSSSEVPVVNAEAPDPWGTMVAWFNFESFTGNYNLVYNQNDNTITFSIIATEIGPSMNWPNIATGTNAAKWKINGTLNLSTNTFTGIVTGTMSNSIYSESNPVEYDLTLSGNVDLASNQINFSGNGWVFYPYVPE